jgi:tetratricopeptide (TPR) repeat protein
VAGRLTGLVCFFLFSIAALSLPCFAQPPAEHPPATGAVSGSSPESTKQPTPQEDHRLGEAYDANYRLQYYLQEFTSKFFSDEDYQAGLEFDKRLLGEQSPLYARALSNVAALYCAKGEYAKALPLLQQAVAIQKKALGERNPECAIGLSNLATLYASMGQYAKAEPLLQKVLEINKKLLGEQHPQYALSVNNLVGLYYNMGELSKAASLQEKALQSYKSSLGEHHPHYATVLLNLAALYAAMGDNAKALPLARQAVETQRKILGRHHPDYAAGLNTLVTVYANIGEYAQAGALCQEAVEIQKKVLGQQHPFYATSLNNLAILYSLGNQRAKAEPLLQEALEIRKNVLGKRHPDYATSLNNLAAMCAQRGDQAKAMTLAGEAAGIQLQVATDVVAAMPEAQSLNYVSKELGPPSLLLSLASDGHAEELYEQVWARRGLVQQCVGRRQRQLQRIQSPEVRQRYQEYLATRQSLAALIVAPASPDLRQAQAALRRLKELGDKKERLERQLAAELPEFRRQLESSRRGHKELAARLPDGVTLIDLLSYHDYREQVPNQLGRAGPGAASRYAAFLLSRNRSVTRVEIGPAGPIDQAVTAWRADPDGATAASAPALRRLVWEPVEKALPRGTHTVYLCPDGDLTRLPWVALPGRSPGGVLLDDYALAVVPSGQFLLEQLTASSSAGGAGRLLAVGGVSYDAEPRHTAAAAAILATRSAAIDGGAPAKWPS